MEPQPNTTPPSVEPVIVPSKPKWPWILGGLVLLVLVGIGGIFLGRQMTSTTSIANTTPAASIDQASNWQIYSDSLAGFSISYPSAWEAKVVAQTKLESGVYWGDVEFSGVDGSVKIVFGNGFGGGGCSSFNGKLVNITLDSQPAQICLLDEAAGYTWRNTGDSGLVNRGDTGFAFSAQSTSKDQSTVDLINQMFSTFKFTDTPVSQATPRPVLSPPLLDTSSWKLGAVENVSFKYPADYTTRLRQNSIELISPSGQYGSSVLVVAVYSYDGGSRREWFINRMHDLNGESIASIEKYSLAQEVKLGSVNALDFWMDGGWWQGGYTSPIIIASGKSIVTITPSSGRLYRPDTGETGRWDIMDTVGSTVKFN